MGQNEKPVYECWSISCPNFKSHCFIFLAFCNGFPCFSLIFPIPSFRICFPSNTPFVLFQTSTCFLSHVPHIYQHFWTKQTFALLPLPAWTHLHLHMHLLAVIVISHKEGLFCPLHDTCCKFLGRISFVYILSAKGFSCLNYTELM